MSGRFDGKVVMITGATSGLGKHAAVAFAREGARVVASGRRQAEGEETLAEIEAAGGTAVFVQADVSVSEDVARIVAAARDRFGGLDWAYNVAGVPGDAFAKAAEYSEDAWDETMEINVKGVFLCVKHAIPAMLERGGGAIVNMSSIAGIGGSPGGVAYVASKHAIIGLTKAAALDYAEQNIRINALAPGVIYTDMLAWGITQTPGLEADLISQHPIGRLGQLEEVTNAAMWLCSDEAGFVTGTTLTVDGGHLAR
ncbi:MAG TPA: glucose 1-dehydrogenase [Pseudomonadales bacterium]|jgi:NAD(P)-dependent dehydrogenase (short-subunit alcohol dehydrogenase family)